MFRNNNIASAIPSTSHSPFGWVVHKLLPLPSNPRYDGKTDTRVSHYLFITFHSLLVRFGNVTWMWVKWFFVFRFELFLELQCVNYDSMIIKNGLHNHVGINANGRNIFPTEEWVFPFLESVILKSANIFDDATCCQPWRYEICLIVLLLNYHSSITCNYYKNVRYAVARIYWQTSFRYSFCFCPPILLSERW